MLKGKTVVLGVTGSIAAYKMANVASMLVKLHADVHVIMTENACQFITPVTFETLTGNKCMVDTFDRNFQFHVAHISIAKKADVLLVAPASANVIGKLANGIADDMLTTTAMACTCQKIVAPAMNTNMYHNPILQDNLKKLEGYGFTVIAPEKGLLACRDIGDGKMPSEDVLVGHILREIAHTLEKDNNKVSYGALLAPQVKPIVIIGMVLAIFQQWCGINVIFNYAQEIFASAGFDINSTLKSIVATGVVNLVFTIAALPLVDKIGRRKLMLLGASGLTLIYVLIAGAYAMGIMGWPVLLLVLAAIAIYALTLAPVTWVLLAEIFPNRVRGLAMSLGTLALWIACFLLTYTFPLLNAGLGAAGSFLLYGVICAAGYLYILRNVPETKGITLEALEEQLAQRHTGVNAAKQEQMR